MRILTRVIVAGALVVPMGLGVSGIAGADVPAGTSVLPTQFAASEDEDADDCDKDDKRDKGGDLFDFLSNKGHSNGDECGVDGDGASGLPG